MVQLPIFPAGVTHINSEIAFQERDGIFALRGAWRMGQADRAWIASEVRTMRQKITELCANPGNTERWSTALAKQWMGGGTRKWRGVLRRWACAGLSWKTDRSASALCGAGAALFTRHDWVNAMDGRPFFVVSCPADPGLLGVLREQIVPRLKADVPNQPTLEQLKADPLLSRLTIVFDREGYSPKFFRADERRANRGPDLSQIPWSALAGAGISAAQISA